MMQNDHPDSDKHDGQPLDRTGEAPPGRSEDLIDEAENSGSSEFARMLEQFESRSVAPTPEMGDQIRGRVVEINEETAFVDFGGRSEGAVETRHLRDAEGALTVQIGDEVSLYVVDNRDQVILAPSVRAERDLALGQVQEAQRSGLPVSGQITGINAGGLEVSISGLRGFCPFSQMDTSFVADPATYVGRVLEFLVTEFAEGGKRLVLSRRALLRRDEEEAARRLLERIGEGVELEGTVSRVESFGAFVDIGGLDGLVHVSEISHRRVEHTGEVVAVGQRVKVKVLNVGKDDRGRPRIGLSMKAVEPDPWMEAEEQFWEGRRVSGTVVRVADFGAFVSLSPGIDGLVHVSELDLKPVGHPRDAVQVGQVVEAVVLSVNTERKRISLSIRDALAADHTGASGSSAGASELPQPKPGLQTDGFVSGIKQYGLFVDLPEFGHRARGLVPHEETGEPRGTDLSRRYNAGDKLRVEIIDMDSEGKIRLSMTRVRDRAEEERFEQYREAAGQAKGADGAMAEALRRAMEDAQKRNG